MQTLNQKTVTLKLKRIEVCDLMLACSALSEEGEKWIALHDTLKEILKDFDNKQSI
jgi:hypothetical protein